MEISNIDEYYNDQSKLNCINLNPLSFQNIFRACLVGPSSAGKTNLVMNLLTKSYIYYDNLYILLKDKNEPKYAVFLTDFIEKINEQRVDNPITLLITDNIKDLPDYEAIDNTKQNIIIFDDIVNEPKLQKDIFEMFLRYRKVNCSIIYQSQSFQKIPVAVRANTNYFVIFQISKTELRTVYNSLQLPLTIHEFVEFYNDVFSIKHNFMIIDLVNPVLILRSGFDKILKIDK